jgi:hypothetical protein
MGTHITYSYDKYYSYIQNLSYKFYIQLIFVSINWFLLEYVVHVYNFYFSYYMNFLSFLLM